MLEVPGEDKRLKRKAEVVTFLAGTGGEVSPVALEAAFLRRNPVHLFSAGGARFVVLSTEGGANRVYRAGETRFVRASAREAFDVDGRGWAIGEDALTGPAGETKVREPARRTFWFAWVSQYPDTLLIR